MKFEEFEKRYTNNWFSSGWVEVVPEKDIVEENNIIRKDLTTLENELVEIQNQIEGIELKKLRLSNLAKMYQ